MQEYWVNVYKEGLGIRRHGSAIKSIVYMYFDGPDFMNEVPLYRIHVKMKPRYDDSFARDSAVLAKYEPISLSTLIDDNSFKNRDLLRRAEDLFGVLDYH